MIYRVTKKDKSLKGTIRLTSSKSISNRLLIISELCTDQFSINNLATANDTVLLQQLLNSPFEILNAEDAGTTFRFLTAFLSQKPGDWLLTGSSRMKQRPIGMLVDTLRKLGAEILYTETENFPPLKISGKKLTGREIEIDGSVSSQFISALLLVAPTLENGLKIILTGEISSRPYIEMTLKLMNVFGIHYSWNGNMISIAQQNYLPSDYPVESDWSAASYWFEMAALSDDVDLTLTGLQPNSIQGDSVVAEIMKPFGVEAEFVKEGIRLTKKSASHLPKKFSYNFQSCPDLVQTMAATCAALSVPANFYGVKSLRIKETDRLTALQTELKRIYVESDISDFGFEISDYVQPPISSFQLPSSNLQPPTSNFHTFNDHRMAMSFAPLALIFETVQIENPEVVKKSYPEFWDDLRSVGFEIAEF